MKSARAFLFDYVHAVNDDERFEMLCNLIGVKPTEVLDLGDGRGRYVLDIGDRQILADFDTDSSFDGGVVHAPLMSAALMAMDWDVLVRWMLTPPDSTEPVVVELTADEMRYISDSLLTDLELNEGGMPQYMAEWSYPVEDQYGNEVRETGLKPETVEMIGGLLSKMSV